MDPSEIKTSAWVEHRLGQYLEQIQKELSKKEDYEFVDNILRYSRGF